MGVHQMVKGALIDLQSARDAMAACQREFAEM